MPPESARVPQVGIIYNDGKPTACRVASELEAQLQQAGWEVRLASSQPGLLGYSNPDTVICHTPAESLVPHGFTTSMDAAIVLGGDGTVLAASRLLAPIGVPMLAINTGHLGFLTETYLNLLPEAMDAFLAGQYQVEDRAMMKVKVLRGELHRWEALSLNEMALHREPLTSMCHFEIAIGRHAPVDIAADGVIISTPTGSTAYSLSSGGPVVTPDVPVLQLVPICPHSLASRALVFANTEPVTIFPATPERLMLVVDGNAGCYIWPEDRVLIQRSPYPARFIRLHSAEFFRVLREKLGWGLPHIAKPTAVDLP